MADQCVLALERNIASIDRFNPIYLRLFGAVLGVLFGISLVLVFRAEYASVWDFLRGGLAAASGAISLIGAGIALTEAAVFKRRAGRAKVELFRNLREAEILAGFGFVTTDKLGAEFEDAVKQKSLRLRDVIRDSCERIGAKD